MLSLNPDKTPYQAVPYSSVKGINWPPIANSHSALLLAYLSQFEKNQWLSSPAIETLQFQQINSLLRYAHHSTNYYKNVLDNINYNPEQSIDYSQFQNIPLLTRSLLKNNNSQIQSNVPLTDHGKINTVKTSGSSGYPVHVNKTEVVNLMWNALTIFDHLLHQRHLNKKLVSIRFLFNNKIGNAPHGTQQASWGQPISIIYPTGPSAVLNINTPISQQADFLLHENAEYLLTYPSNLAALAEYFKNDNIKLDNLKQFRTFGETLSSETRSLCREVFGAGIIDMYSCQEVGYLALQCPENEHYHVCSENVFVEILDENNRPCQPGQVGRVIVTSLNNFAQPIIRYDVGDYARVGEPCSCNRGHTVLSEIVGRVRNMFTLPSGDKIWPTLRLSVLGERVGANFDQIQIIQKSINQIKVKIAPNIKFENNKENAIVLLIQESFNHAFEVHFEYCDEIPRGNGGKYEDYLSEITE